MQTHFVPSSKISKTMHEIVFEHAVPILSDATEKAEEQGVQWRNREIVVLYAWACSIVGITFGRSGLITSEEYSEYCNDEANFVIFHIFGLSEDSDDFHKLFETLTDLFYATLATTDHSVNSYTDLLLNGTDDGIPVMTTVGEFMEGYKSVRQDSGKPIDKNLEGLMRLFITILFSEFVDVVLTEVSRRRG